MTADLELLNQEIQQLRERRREVAARRAYWEAKRVHVIEVVVADDLKELAAIVVAVMQQHYRDEAARLRRRFVHRCQRFKKLYRNINQGV